MSLIRSNNILSLEKCIYSYVYAYILRVITYIHIRNTYVYTCVHDSYYHAYDSYN